MKTKHTQGKWEVENGGWKTPLYVTTTRPSDDNKADVTSEIATIRWLLDGKNNTERIKEAEANAKLIAAAPELLGALKESYQLVIDCSKGTKMNEMQRLRVKSSIQQSINVINKASS